MSLGIVFKGPEGIVLAADSRVTLNAQKKTPPNNVTVQSVHFDNTTKLLSFPEHPYVGAVTYGGAVIGRRTPHSYISEFESELNAKRLSVKDFAEHLSLFFQKRAEESEKRKRPIQDDTVFVVGGYNAGKPYGEVYLFSIPNKPNLEEQSSGDNVFGITLGGQSEVAGRLMQGYDPTLLSLLKSSHQFSDH